MALSRKSKRNNPVKSNGVAPKNELPGAGAIAPLFVSIRHVDLPEATVRMQSAIRLILGSPGEDEKDA